MTHDEPLDATPGTLWRLVSAYAHGDDEKLDDIWTLVLSVQTEPFRGEEVEGFRAVCDDMFLCISEFQAGHWSEEQLSALLFQIMRMSPFQGLPGLNLEALTIKSDQSDQSGPE